nr:hypothetical protein Iba_chr04aCG13570 [Ipomoea batatas]GMC84609.1 hypothetical protein Iba_chr04cCG13260 [Ipomoea batatas]
MRKMDSNPLLYDCKPKPSEICWLLTGFRAAKSSSFSDKINSIWQGDDIIAFGIPEQIKNKPSRFHRPTSLSIRMSVLCLCSSPHTSTETGEGNGLLVDQNIFQIPFSLV